MMGILIFKLLVVYAVISPIAAASAFDVVDTAHSVLSGASMLYDMATAKSYRVMCRIEVENWTKYPLEAPSSHIHYGIIEYPPVVVKPGKKEMFVAHKTGLTATGTSGTASWGISGMNKRGVVMWSCPFDFHTYSNWLAVGLTKSEDGHHDWFNKMYYHSSGNGIEFVRGEYYYKTTPIAVNDGQFEVSGTMGTSHQATAHIIVRPTKVVDLAPGFDQHYLG